MVIPEIWLKEGSHDLKFKNHKNREDYTLEIRIPITIRGVPTAFKTGTRVTEWSSQILGGLAINGRISLDNTANVKLTPILDDFRDAIDNIEKKSRKNLFLLEHVAMQSPLSGMGLQSSVGLIDDIVLSGCCFHHFEGWAVRVSKLDNFLMKRCDVTSNLSGVRVDPSGGPAVLENCLIAMNDKHGIFAKSEYSGYYKPTTSTCNSLHIVGNDTYIQKNWQQNKESADTFDISAQRGNRRGRDSIYIHLEKSHPCFFNDPSYGVAPNNQMSLAWPWEEGVNYNRYISKTVVPSTLQGVITLVNCGRVVWVPNQCAYCAKTSLTTGMRKCGGCQTMRYCNQNCAKKHWKSHKTECSFVKTLPLFVKTISARNNSMEHLCRESPVTPSRIIAYLVDQHFDHKM